jgi:hypothetical protein
MIIVTASVAARPESVDEVLRLSLEHREPYGGPIR